MPEAAPPREPDRPGEQPEPSTWPFAEGDAIAPGLFAWTLLGSGRRFETWLAWSCSQWGPVTVKMPHPDGVDVRARRAFATETALVGHLRHPGLQPLLDAQPWAARPHLVYEYLEGPSLDALLDDGPLSPGDVVRLGMQLAAALHHLHLHDVVHLDLKPENVIVCSGRAVVFDFDIACAVGTPARPGHPRGSSGFMAPEQVRCQPAAPSMDLFALGATLYEAATAQPAFPSADDDEGGYPQLMARPRPLRELAPGVGPELETAISALLAPDPRRRPPDALGALELLARARPAGEEGLWPAWVDRLLRRVHW